MILETELSTASGRIEIVDFMPPREEHPTLVRLVYGLTGRVRMTIPFRRSSNTTEGGPETIRSPFGNWDGGRSTNTTAHAEVRALSLLPLRASATSRRPPMPRWLARRSEPG
jgi:hypothetical protein